MLTSYSVAGLCLYSVCASLYAGFFRLFWLLSAEFVISPPRGLIFAFGRRKCSKGLLSCQNEHLPSDMSFIDHSLVLSR